MKKNKLKLDHDLESLKALFYLRNDCREHPRPGTIYYDKERDNFVIWADTIKPDVITLYVYEIGEKLYNLSVFDPELSQFIYIGEL